MAGWPIGCGERREAECPCRPIRPADPAGGVEHRPRAGRGKGARCPGLLRRGSIPFGTVRALLGIRRRGPIPSEQRISLELSLFRWDGTTEQLRIKRGVTGETGGLDLITPVRVLRLVLYHCIVCLASKRYVNVSIKNNIQVNKPPPQVSIQYP